MLKFEENNKLAKGNTGKLHICNKPSRFMSSCVCIYSILILAYGDTDRTDQSEGLQTQWKIRKLNSVDLHHTNPSPHVFLIYKHFTL